MSEIALLTAAQSRLVSQLGYTVNKDVAILPDGRPGRIAGDTFVSLWSLPKRGGPRTNRTIEEQMGFTATVNLRSTGQPWDRWGAEVYIKATTGLEAVARPIIDLFSSAHPDSSIALLRLANDSIAGTPSTVDGFITGIPLVFQGQTPEVKSAEWWGGQGNWAGIACHLRFFGATRLQKVGAFT